MGVCHQYLPVFNPDHLRETVSDYLKQANLYELVKARLDFMLPPWDHILYPTPLPTATTSQAPRSPFKCLHTFT